MNQKMNDEIRALKNMEMCWEYKVPKRPKAIWRLRFFRSYQMASGTDKGQNITEYFADERSAKQRRGFILSNGDKFSRFRRRLAMKYRL